MGWWLRFGNDIRNDVRDHIGPDLDRRISLERLLVDGVVDWVVDNIFSGAIAHLVKRRIRGSVLVHVGRRLVDRHVRLDRHVLRCLKARVDRRRPEFGRWLCASAPDQDDQKARDPTHPVMIHDGRTLCSRPGAPYHPGMAAQVHVTVPCPVWQVEGTHAVWLSSEACVRQQVAGETFNRQHVDAVVERSGGRVGQRMVAWLAPEPTNPADPNAVMVWMGGGKVGYLPRTDALAWVQIIAGLMRDKRLPVACLGHIEPPRSGEWGLQVFLWLPPIFPHQAPLALAPAGVDAAIAKVDHDHQNAEVIKQQAAADQARWKAERLAHLVKKFGTEAAANIVAKRLWLGATSDMVLEAFGTRCKDQVKTLKTKVKRTLSFADDCTRCGGSGYIPEFAHIEDGRCRQCRGTGTSTKPSLVVRLENDLVVGWEDNR